MFVATFSLIFVLFGLGATVAGDFLFDNQPLLNDVAGALIVAMGGLFVASVFVARLNRDFRPDALARRAGRGGPVVAGAAFAVAWTPCVGPTLGAILGLASTQSGTGQGALLLGVYSAGLAVPFMFSAVAFGAASRSFAFFKRHYAAIQVSAGAVLIAMGVLVLTGELWCTSTSRSWPSWTAWGSTSSRACRGWRPGRCRRPGAHLSFSPNAAGWGDGARRRTCRTRTG